MGWTGFLLIPVFAMVAVGGIELGANLVPPTDYLFSGSRVSVAYPDLVSGTTGTVFDGNTWAAKAPSGRLLLALQPTHLDPLKRTLTTHVSLAASRDFLKGIRYEVGGQTYNLATATPPAPLDSETMRIELTACASGTRFICPPSQPLTLRMADLAMSLFPRSLSDDVELPLLATPASYPGDIYGLDVLASARLPLLFDYGPNSGNLLPLELLGGTDPSLADQDVAVYPLNLKGGTGAFLIAGFKRPLLTQLYVVGLALIPMLFVFITWSLFVRHRPRHAPPNADFLTGLAASILALLPLRAALVPQDLAPLAITRIDLILGLELALFAGVGVLRFCLDEADRRSPVASEDGRPGS